LDEVHSGFRRVTFSFGYYFWEMWYALRLMLGRRLRQVLRATQGGTLR